MTMSDSNKTDGKPVLSETDSTDYKQLAVMIVNNLLTRAVSKASEQILNSADLQNLEKLEYNGLDSDLFPPEIQIDLVGTRTPSPEEDVQFEWSVNKKQYRFKSPVDQQSISNETDISSNDFEFNERENLSFGRNSNFDINLESSEEINLIQIKDFAKEYVENIISSAIEVFNIETTVNDKSELKNSMSDNQCFDSCTWMARIRQVIRQLMRSSCLCKTKQQFRQRKS